jgi:DNA-binding transcriptional MerR regulator
MGDNSYAEKIKAANLMMAGLTAHLTELSKRGVSQADIEKLQNVYNKANTLDREQEALKAQTKAKTEELRQVMEKIDELMRELRKIVKLDMPQQYWVEFGITDQR